jgi:hypothetical protein
MEHSSRRRQKGVTVVAKTKGKRVALYLRVSTSEQTAHNQRRELQAVAARHKWDVVDVFEDAGISALAPAIKAPSWDVGAWKTQTPRRWQRFGVPEKKGLASSVLRAISVSALAPCSG